MPSKPPGLKPRRQRKPWDHKRSAADRGYGKAHRAIRAQLLAEEPLCRQCDKEGRITPAVIADHITPLSQGGKTIRSNYQPLCKRCSDAKTARERVAARGR